MALDALTLIWFTCDWPTKGRHQGTASSQNDGFTDLSYNRPSSADRESTKIRLSAEPWGRPTRQKGAKSLIAEVVTVRRSMGTQKKQAGPKKRTGPCYENHSRLLPAIGCQQVECVEGFAVGILPIISNLGSPRRMVPLDGESHTRINGG